MSEKLLTLVVSGEAERKPAVVEQALACWTGADRPKLQTLTLEQAAAQDPALSHTALAWLVLEGPQNTAAINALASLQEQRITVLLSEPGAANACGELIDSGVIAGPLSTEPAALALVLRTLWSQSHVIDELRSEVRFIQSHHGKLCDQIGKIDEELRLAAQLQREFLPAELPSLFNVEFKALFRPAGYVSGDIYDVVRLDEKHVGMFVADAVGHGVPAALLTMYIKRSLHTKDVDRGAPRGYRIVPPNEALAKLNHDMVRQNVGGQIRFATAVYAVINCQTLEMQVSRAGHPFPLVLRASGKTQSIEADGGMLGVFDDETYELQTLNFAPGDRLLMYSDGFEMAFPETRDRATSKSVPSPSHHYTRELEDLANGPLDEALLRLGARLDEQAGSLNQVDDLTVVAMAIAPEQAAPQQSVLKRLLTV